MSAPPQLSIVPSADGLAVLAVPSADGGWSLPAHTHTEARRINEFLAAEHGVRTLVAGAVAERVHDKHVGYVFAHLNRGGEPVGGARFVDRSAFTEPDPILDDWFSGAALARLDRVAWARPGWFEAAEDWMRSHATAEVTGELEQFLCSAWSCHLRLPTADGVLHAKAAAPEFGFEAALTAWIAARAPEAVVPVLAVNEELRLLLAGDVGLYPNVTICLEHVPVYSSALARYAAIQEKSLGRLDELVQMGLPDRRPAALPDLFKQILADTDWLFVGEAGLTPQEHSRLTAYADGFARRCDQLDAIGLPDALVNFDFWRGNLEATPTGTVIYDWAECAIGNPVTSLVTVMRDFEVKEYQDGPHIRDALLTAYLEQWLGFASMPKLREAAELAKPMGILCRALCWKDCIGVLDDRDAYQNLRNVVAMNVKRLLPYAE